jgi:hypothetical protein
MGGVCGVRSRGKEGDCDGELGSEEKREVEQTGP